MPTLLRTIAVIQVLAGLVLAIMAWPDGYRPSFGAYLLALAPIASGIIAAVTTLALVVILEGFERQKARIDQLGYEVLREIAALRGRDAGAAQPAASRAAASPIEEVRDPGTGRVAYRYNGKLYDSRLSALAKFTEDDRRGTGGS